MNDRGTIFNGPWIANCHNGIRNKIPDQTSLANAAFIVRAVNSHEMLIKSLKRACLYFEAMGLSQDHEAWKMALESISKAEGSHDER